MFYPLENYIILFEYKMQRLKYKSPELNQQMDKKIRDYLIMHKEYNFMLNMSATFQKVKTDLFWAISLGKMRMQQESLISSYNNLKDEQYNVMKNKTSETN